MYNWNTSTLFQRFEPQVPFQCHYSKYITLCPMLTLVSWPLASRIWNLSSNSDANQLRVNFAQCLASAIISLYESVSVRLHRFQIRKILSRSKLIYFLM